MANAHGVMMVMLDVAYLMMVRRGNSSQRCGQSSAKHHGGQTGKRLDNGFHGQTLRQ